MFFVDDFQLGCAENTDCDACADVFDCAPADPDHWTDCGVCFDQDADGHGAGVGVHLDPRDVGDQRAG